MVSATPFVVITCKDWALQCNGLGMLMSLIFANLVLDAGALVLLGSFLFLSQSRSFSLAGTVEATVGIWECILVASLALQLALLFSVFRVYRELRLVGAYPLSAKLRKPGQRISPLEIVCEPHVDREQELLLREDTR
eukprot:NODE_17766_length_926_cov_9.856070.p1 GENE.NODE_17766_length_926_cov_9.856070~~NODE_17766_length_926_cov_9.856070.p1  ORF type:complete len:156 (+),score=35.73 NODE_17766_length_926_cov_9.856070:58-468(+)